MSTVSKRDLNQHTAEVLAQVIQTGEVVITERGEPRWRVSSYDGGDDALARAERRGHYTPPPSTAVAWPATVGGPKYRSTDVDALLDEFKGDH